MKRLNISIIIHIFALLHASTAIFCHYAGMEDELMLTVLTMLMTLLICRKEKLNIELTAASIIIANIIGYVMGNLGADILEKFLSSASLIHAISTTVTTEILGWSMVILTRILHNDNENNTASAPDYQLKWALIAVGGILALRLLITVLFSHTAIETESLLTAFVSVYSNSFLLITLFCANIIYIWYNERLTKGLSKLTKGLLLIVFFSLTTLLVTAFIFWMTSDKDSVQFRFPSLYITTLLAQTTIYCIVWMINYALMSKKKIQKERGKANLAEYRYLKLKHQVNPHFLFNSLNILDCLVCDEESEKASEYIHKLAGIYRYMIKSEDEDLVPLRDELEFVQKYIDLLRVRFPEGFRVEMNVQEKALNKYVLPCALQLLIENAIKHNAVNADKPLIIKLETDENHVWVSNNIIPKFGKIESTGLGQKYLRQQYLDLSGQNIDIQNTTTEFKVTLPLI